MHNFFKTNLTLGKKSKKYYEESDNNSKVEETVQIPIEILDKTPQKSTACKASQTGINKKLRSKQCASKSFSTISTQTEKETTIGTHLHNLLQDMWECFAETLQKNNQTQKFVKLITALSNGFLKSSNVVCTYLILCLALVP